MSEELMNKLTEYKNRKIQERYNPIESIKIIHVYDKSEIDKKYISALIQISRIDYPPQYTMEYNNSYSYVVDFLYNQIGVNSMQYNWLVPEFGGGSQWYEIVVNDLYAFLDFYFNDTKLEQFSACDLINNVVFDIEHGEKGIDVYLLRLEAQ